MEFEKNRNPMDQQWIGTNESQLGDVISPGRKAAKSRLYNE